MKFLILVALIGTACALPFSDIFDRVVGEIDNKPGRCPVIPAGGFGVCVTNCESDRHCDGIKKCCPTSCGGAVCMVADIPEPDEPTILRDSVHIESQWQRWVESKRQMIQKLQRFPEPPRFFKEFYNTTDALRFCTSTPCEWKKCERMANTFTYNLKPRKEWACALATSPEHCMAWVEQGYVDMMITRDEDIYTAKTKYNLLPIAYESTQTKQTPPSEWQNITLAVARITTPIDTLSELQSRRACISRANSTASFKAPIGGLIQQNIIPQRGDFVQSAGDFFGESCVPGILNKTFDKNGTYPVTLLARCREDAARYEDLDGSIRCLKEDVGEVAFIDHKKIQSMLLEDTIPSAETQFKLVCKSGSQPLSEWQTKDCHISKVPQPTIFISPRKRELKTVIQELFAKAVQTYSGKSAGVFKLFDSNEYNCPNDNLLFKEESNVIINIDETIKPHAEAFFRVMDTVEQLVPKTMCRVCVTKPELYEGCQLYKGYFERIEMVNNVAWGCVLAKTKMECMQAIANDTADLLTADPTETFIAGREFKLQPFMSQQFDTLFPQVSGKSQYDNTTYTYTIGIITKERLFEKYGSNIRYLNMSELKTCHAGISKLSSFKHPIGWLLANGTIPRIGSVFESVSRFFNQTCLPGAAPSSWTWDKDLVLGQELNWGFSGYNFYNFTGYEWFNMNMPNTWNYYNWKGMSPRFLDVFFKALQKGEIKELLTSDSFRKAPFLRRILTSQPYSLRDLLKLLDLLPEEIHGLEDEPVILNDEDTQTISGIDVLIQKLKATQIQSPFRSTKKSKYWGKSNPLESITQQQDPVLTSLLSNLASKQYNIEEQLTEFLEYINESPAMMNQRQEEFSWIMHPAIKSFLQVYSRRFVNVDLFDNVALREHELNRYFSPLWNSPQIGQFLERTKIHQERLCSACGGLRDANCTETPEEPYSDYEGSLECLKNQAGDIAFLEAHTADRLLRSARMQPTDVAMVCRNGEVIDFTQDEEILKSCSFGAVPHSVLMIAQNRSGSWRWNVTKSLLYAQRRFDISPMAEVFVPDHTSFKFQPIPLINQTYEVYLGPMLLRSFEALIKPSSYDWWKAETNVCWGETYTNVLTQRNGTCNAIVKDVTCSGTPSPIVVSIGRIGEKKKVLVPMCSRPTNFQRQMAEFTCNNGATYLKMVMAPTACECIPCEEISTQPTWNKDYYFTREERKFVPRSYDEIQHLWGNEEHWADNTLNRNFDLKDATIDLKDLQEINQRTVGTKTAPLCEKPWIGDKWQREWFPQQSSAPVCEQKSKIESVRKIQMIVGQIEKEQPL